MTGTINVIQALEEAREHREHANGFRMMLERGAEELAVEAYLKADDKDLVRAQWGDALSRGLERWKATRKRKVEYHKWFHAYRSGKMSRTEFLSLVHNSEHSW